MYAIPLAGHVNFPYTRCSRVYYGELKHNILKSTRNSISRLSVPEWLYVTLSTSLTPRFDRCLIILKTSKPLLPGCNTNDDTATRVRSLIHIVEYGKAKICLLAYENVFSSRTCYIFIYDFKY